MYGMCGMYLVLKKGQSKFASAKAAARCLTSLANPHHHTRTRPPPQR